MLFPQAYENDSELYELFPYFYQSHFAAYLQSPGRGGDLLRWIDESRRL